jgi:hypothetical protein
MDNWSTTSVRAVFLCVLVAMDLAAFVLGGHAEVATFSWGSDNEDACSDCVVNQTTGTATAFSWGSDEECFTAGDNTPTAELGPPMPGSAAGSSAGSSSVSVRGKYPRGPDKGVHHTWADRARMSMEALESNSWLNASPCDKKCRFAKMCLGRVNQNDARACIEFTFGHSDPTQLPTKTLSTASDQWFALLLDGRIVDHSSRAVVGIARKLNVENASGIEVCSRTACFLYKCADATWNAMVTAVMTGQVTWKEVSRINGIQARKWAENKRNDSCMWWVDRIKQCAPPYANRCPPAIAPPQFRQFVLALLIGLSRCQTDLPQDQIV